MTAGEAKNVDNAVVLARLFNEASGQKAPSKKHGLFISRPLGTGISFYARRGKIRRPKSDSYRIDVPKDAILNSWFKC